MVRPRRLQLPSLLSSVWSLSAADSTCEYVRESVRESDVEGTECPVLAPRLAVRRVDGGGSEKTLGRVEGIVDRATIGDATG